MSCSSMTYATSISNPPVTSFVKIIHQTSIISCTENQRAGECPVGDYVSTGSGMVVAIHPKFNTVLTAGHVCEAPVKNTVKSFVDIVEVLDYKGVKHQAHKVLTSLDNRMGKPDMCVLWVPTLNRKEIVKVKLAGFAPRIGQELYYIGAPAGVYHPPVAPIFKGVYSGDINASSSLVTVPAFGGSSGSSVMTLKNEFVGVLWAVHPQFHHISVVSNFKSTRAFLAVAWQILDAASKK